MFFIISSILLAKVCESKTKISVYFRKSFHLFQKKFSLNLQTIFQQRLPAFCDDIGYIDKAAVMAGD